MKDRRWLAVALRVGAAGTLVAALLGGVTFAAPLPASMGSPVRWHLEIPHFGSASTGSPSKIDIASWSWGMSTPPGVVGSGGGAGAGQTQTSPLSIRRTIDAASPVFLHALVTGSAFATVKLVGDRAGRGGKLTPFVVLTFANVKVVSDQFGGTNGTSPVETLNLEFSKAQLQVAGQGAAMSSSGAVPTVSYDLTTSKAG